jgi:hypothetical protein
VGLYTNGLFSGSLFAGGLFRTLYEAVVSLGGGLWRKLKRKRQDEEETILALMEML